MIFFHILLRLLTILILFNNFESCLFKLVYRKPIAVAVLEGTVGRVTLAVCLPPTGVNLPVMSPTEEAGRALVQTVELWPGA